MPTDAIAAVAHCAACGTELSPLAKFCSECGNLVAGSTALPRLRGVERLLTTASTLEGERKLLTVLFADLRGSTELIVGRDPEEARELLEPVLERMCDTVESYGGTVSQVMGDGIMALFGAPVSLEDHAVRACHAALAMQERIRHSADAVERTRGVPIQIRVGLSSGEAVLNICKHGLHLSYTAIGQTVHLAARMEQMARPGTVLAAADTVHLANAFIEAHPIGPVAVKGFERPIEIFEVERPARWRSRFDIALVRGVTPFTGRDSELHRLVEMLVEVIDDGTGRLAVVVGDAGIGKSRLIHEFLKELTGRNVLALDGGAAPYGSGAWYRPGVHILRQYFEIAETDDIGTQQQKVTERIMALGGDVDAVAAPILLLLHALPTSHRLSSLALSERRDQVFAALMWLAARITAERPLVLVYEDLQWTTSDTRDFLHAFVRDPPHSTLLVLTYRSDYDGRWAREHAALELRLEGLAAPATRRVIAELLGWDPSLAELGETVVRRSGGNPLFIEEYARSAIESGVLEGSPGNYRMGASSVKLEVPPTVRAVLAARIDRLERVDKHVMQALAAIGEFAMVNVLEKVAGEPADAVRRSLRRLMLAGLLVERADREHLGYEFKHALTQAVTYDTLLHDRRLELHRAILTALEGVADFDVLARHAVLGEVWDRALVNLREAGHQRAAQFASLEAIACFERALGVLEHLPKSRAALEARFDILCDLRNVLVPLGPHERLAQVLESASALAKALGDEERLAKIYSFLSHYYGNVGRSDLAVETGERALVLGQRVGAVSLLIVGSMSVGEICRTLGDYRKALVLFRQALAHIHPDAELDRLGRVGLPAVRVRSHLAWTLAELGDFPAARESAEAGLRLADRTKHPYDLAHACLGLGGVHVRQGEFEAAVSILARGLALTDEVPLLRPPIVADLGLAQARCGRVVEGMALVNEAVERANTIGRISRLALLIVKCGEVHLLAGDALTASDCAAKALRLATEQKERGNVVYATRLFAAIRASEQPGSPEVAARYREALQLARELGMRPLIAHCHTGLAQHYARVSARRQARQHHAAAAALYRAMGMRHWLGQLEMEPS
jgi:class 3 adenylate cyclase/tetratricopeptide (TPR) repeat protein